MVHIDRTSLARFVTRPYEPIASRYFPATSQTFLSGTSATFLLTFSHAAGVASFSDDELEIMLSRRTLVDDGKRQG